MDDNDMVYNFNQTYANSKYKGIVTAFGDINRLKRNWHNNTRGFKGSAINVFHVNDKDNVIAFHRWDRGGKGDDVVVLVNLGNTDFDAYNIGIPRSGDWYCRFNSDSTLYDESFGNFGCKTTQSNSGRMDGLDYNMNVEVPKFSVLVYSQ